MIISEKRVKLDRLFIPILYNSLNIGKKITNNLNIKAMTREDELIEATSSSEKPNNCEKGGEE